MTRFLMLLVVLVSNSVSIAQKEIKYKNIYPLIGTQSAAEVYPLLLQFQRQDPKHANVYYQLGLMAERWSHDYDPFLQPSDVKFFTYHTKVYFGLSKKYVVENEDKEARRNGEYYQGITPASGKKEIEWTDINQALDKHLDSNQIFEQNILTLQTSLNKSVDFYNECIVIFKDINGRYAKIKDMYLMADDSLRYKVRTLSALFDSTTRYFDAYRTALDGYPIKGYNQNYKLRPIITYRLEGLTSSNFLNNKVELWNYKAWAADLTKTLDTEIADLRKLIAKTETDLNGHITALENDKKYTTLVSPYMLTNETVFRIGKYDHQSLMVDFFNYKNAKIAFWAASHHPNNNPADTSKLSLAKRVPFYRDLTYQKLTADSLQAVFKKNIDEVGVKKYADIFQNQYKGMYQLRKYADDQATKDNDRLNASFDNLRKFVLADFSPKADTFVTYNKAKIPVNARYFSITNIISEQHYTTAAQTDNKGNTYITGYIKPERGQASAYIGKVNRKGKVEWLKQMQMHPLDGDFGLMLQLSGNGCVALLASPTQGIIENTLVALDSTGKETLKKTLAIQTMPRYMDYDQINERFMLAFKGKLFGLPDSDFGALDLINVYITGETSWSKQIPLQGNLIDIVRTDDRQIVFCNFSEYINEKQQNIMSKAGKTNAKTNVMAVVFNNEGQIVGESVYYNLKPFFGLRAIKIDSETINIVGLQADYSADYHQKPPTTGKLLFLLTNADATIRYGNFD